MRDRLIELLNEANQKSNIIGTGDTADYLLENGVIVPPCKVGDTLYIVREDIQKTIEVVVMAIIQRLTFQYAEVLIVEDNRKSLITLAYWGDRLFSNREEAEQALKGEQSDGKL